MVVVNWQEMVSWVDINNFKHFPELKTPPWDFRYSGNLNTIMWIAITIAGSESEELTINQSGNAIDLASTVNLRNTLGL